MASVDFTIIENLRDEGSSVNAPKSTPANRDDLRELRKLGMKRLRRFSSLSAKVMQTARPKAIHDVRVASRRLQQILDCLYRPPRPAAVRRLRSRIRSVRRSLGELRDYDVFIASMERRLRPKEPVQRSAVIVMRERLGKHRARLMKKAHNAIIKNDVPGLCAQLNTLLSHAGPGDRAGPQQPPIEAVVHKAWKKFAKQVAKSLRGPRPANMHQVRIRAKRLRYLLEVVAELGNPDVEAHLEWLRRLQQCLGEWHDLEIQETILLKMGSRGSSTSDRIRNDILIDMIHAMHGAKENLEQEYRKTLVKGGGWRRLRRWMAAGRASKSQRHPRDRLKTPHPQR
jgi:CHAD domain-containing protein